MTKPHEETPRDEAIAAALEFFEGSGSGKSGFPDRMGDFRLLYPLGGGGMGVVYLAVQESLGRKVALKLVRPDQLYFEGSRERFRREVETVARLQHPGIVPVYAVGEEHGLPYFAMERVRGQTLATILQELRDRNPAHLRGSDLEVLLPPEEDMDCGVEREADPLFDGSWETVCLRIARLTAEALEHAHRRGVVHRDIKPSNVMITRDGRVLLVDFGLSSNAGSERITKTGSPMGSLAYMAPEVLRGESAQDPRVDVYSLGMTLYELLALKLPFASSGPAELHGKILNAEKIPLRKLRPHFSWEAETLCSVSTDSAPERRYASAGDFARDLKNALEARPLEARPPGPMLRARRWVQRHPLRTALFLAAMTVPSLLFLQEYRRRHEVLAKNTEIERALEESEENLRTTLSSVDRMLARIGEQTLTETPRLESVRRELLEDALELYEGILARPMDDPLLQREMALVATRAGNLHLWLNEPENALRSLSRADEFLRGLLAADEDIALTAELAHVLATRAEIEKQQGDLDAAKQSLAEAFELVREKTATSLEAREVFAQCWTTQSELDRVSGSWEEAENALRMSARLHRSLLDEKPEDEKLVYVTASVIDNLATLITDGAKSTAARMRAASPRPSAGRRQLMAEARAFQEEAIELIEGLLEHGPDSAGRVEYRLRLARLLVNLAIGLREAGEHEEAKEILLRWRDIQAGLEQHPAAGPAHAFVSRMGCYHLSRLLLSSGRLEDARSENRALLAFEPEAEDYLGAALFLAECLEHLRGETSLGVDETNEWVEDIGREAGEILLSGVRTGALERDEVEGAANLRPLFETKSFVSVFTTD